MTDFEKPPFYFQYVPRPNAGGSQDNRSTGGADRGGGGGGGGGMRTRNKATSRQTQNGVGFAQAASNEADHRKDNGSENVPPQRNAMPPPSDTMGKSRGGAAAVGETTGFC